MAVPQWALSSFKLECWAGSILHSLISGIHLSRVSISCASHPKICTIEDAQKYFYLQYKETYEL